MLYEGFSFKRHNRSELSTYNVNAVNFICNMLNDSASWSIENIIIKNFKNLVGQANSNNVINNKYPFWLGAYTEVVHLCSFFLAFAPVIRSAAWEDHPRNNV